MNIIERAFQIARSGDCSDMRDLERRLKGENFEGVLQHLHGPKLRRELATLIRTSGAGGTQAAE